MTDFWLAERVMWLICNWSRELRLLPRPRILCVLLLSRPWCFRTFLWHYLFSFVNIEVKLERYGGGGWKGEFLTCTYRLIENFAVFWVIIKVCINWDKVMIMGHFLLVNNKQTNGRHVFPSYSSEHYWQWQHDSIPFDRIPFLWLHNVNGCFR